MITQRRITRSSIIKNGGYLSKPLDSGKTFFDISVNIDQIGMVFEAESFAAFSVARQ